MALSGTVCLILFGKDSSPACFTSTKGKVVKIVWQIVTKSFSNYVLQPRSFVNKASNGAWKFMATVSAHYILTSKEWKFIDRKGIWRSGFSKKPPLESFELLEVSNFMRTGACQTFRSKWEQGISYLHGGRLKSKLIVIV